MVIVADIDRCMGAGQCVLTYPERFDQSDEGTVVVLDPQVDDPTEWGRLRDTVALCPSRALSVVA
ncbi:ferredoxin [Frankia sp. AiPs1]|uniref:ferredoxin n=1 Tax=Frankia sp. AiPs1 TaxID=573493 RepID=UPI0020439D45|nr:ferredoxin [Frankia sp. AiPs1]MCM3924607.1 ferredoxin [Frankia sp. AiPs1]